jgi:tetratricopeptide (TPR) repeat protein
VSGRGALLAALIFLMGLTSAANVQRESITDGAKQAYEKGDYPKAIEILKAAAAQEPRNGEIYLLLTQAYYQMQDRDLAIQSAQKAVAIDPNDSKYHEWLGRAYGDKAGHVFWFSAISLAKKSRREFETAVKLDGRNFSAMQALIEYDCSAPGIVGGGLDKAQLEIERISQLDPAEGDYAKGNCRRQKNDFATADEEFTKALKSDPISSNLIYDIGDYAMKRKLPEMLALTVEAGEKADPGDPRGEFYRAVRWILLRQKLDEAQKKIQHYLETAPIRDNYPSPSWAHFWLGRALEAENRLDAARKEYQTAVKLDPGNKAAKEQLQQAAEN